MINSPIQTIRYNDINFLIKRDDLLDKQFSGNKARKFYYYLNKNFPDINKIISYGSNQSNAMYSLSVLAKLKDWDFTYYVSHISSYLQNCPNGNYKYALENGMNIIVDKNFNKETLKINKNKLFVYEGGAVKEAKDGLQILANEINIFIINNNLFSVKVFLPSGTGTTALFLSEFLNVKLFTCSCVGDDEYLSRQFFQLQKDKSKHPKILKKEKKFHFGKLYKSSYDIWLDLKKQTNIEFDLLYDPIGWQTLFYNKNYIDINNILYIHQGGLIGNITMLQRYERKYKI
jgi:1-aminocyclopropane-1-carboxylate deaminase/D-cysteine desulfhydrase-like pyridoxal-dependent ACC family enzyme